MNVGETTECKVLDFPTGEPNRTWALAATDDAASDDRLIVSIAGERSRETIGRFHAKTGNVLAPEEDERTEHPAVLNIGDPNGATGQLKARQPKGNYLRVCRWDRLTDDQVPTLQPTARFRTLPQCGCGGYLGTPKFFDTFAEMSAYVFCNFYA